VDSSFYKGWETIKFIVGDKKMAKRRRKVKRRPARRVKRTTRRTVRRAVRRAPSYSKLNAQELFLDRHDEDKALLFATGIMLGIGIAATIMGSFVYGGVVAIIIALTLLFLERRQ